MRKNILRDYSGRPWKTPSPAPAPELKSPRYLRNNLVAPPDPGRLIKQQPSPSPSAKPKPTYKSFHHQIKQAKERPTRTSTQHQDRKILNDYGIEVQRRGSREQDGTSPYLMKPVPRAPSYQKNYRSPNHQPQSKGHTPRHEQGSANHSRSSSKYRDQFNKYISEISRIKQQNNKLYQDYLKTAEEKQKLQARIEGLMNQKQQMRVVLQERKQRQNSLNEQIRKLRDLLDANTSELNNSYYENYKLKQQLYQANLHRQRNEQIRSQQKLEAPDPSKDKSKKVPFCEICTNKDKIIAYMTCQMENKMFELGKKDTIISSLISEIQKVENQLKNYEKPKAVVKRLHGTIEGLNKKIVLSQIKALNQKYKADRSGFK